MLKRLLGLVGASLGLVFWCEYLVYISVIYQCSWPLPVGDYNDSEDGIRAMVLADTHLLGPYRGHWFDKLRREWQMHRAFQTAVGIFQPEVVFFLGDLFDEGMWVSDEAFQHYVDRFKHLFKVPDAIQVIVVPGNHDMGFHYALAPRLYNRFNQAFNSSSMQIINLKEVTFILVNSMAMHDDGCYLCHSAQVRLKNIADKLDCAQNPSQSKCSNKRISSNTEYSKPIILQHFPMFRESDMVCTDPDSAPQVEKEKPFRPKWDCLSKDSTDTLLSALKPRLILSGHTHHACLVHHQVEKNTEVIPEYSVPSFSWRNRNEPSFFLGIFTRRDYTLSKCFMPRESTVIFTYISGILALVIYSLATICIPTLRQRLRRKQE
ncbi:unnamed protein product [Allacma fusca]|uniref:Metallophosphoesterase 1 homolog n=1 Tax=Allacma fusca TaxID=39272 RepID=A0A8J2LSW8_9HEXA|nr:unnamed protein product [Allacma fusca]